MSHFQKFLFLVALWVMFASILSCKTENVEQDISSKVKVALRYVGSELLVSEGDSTSVVLPIKEIEPHIFELSFAEALRFDPETLDVSIAESFKRLELPASYLIEVIQCNDNEVGYSYQKLQGEEEELVSCHGRMLPEACYTVQVTFQKQIETQEKSRIWFYILVGLVLAFLIFVFYSRYITTHKGPIRKDAKPLGVFTFYPNQHLLIRETAEISLSVKECELLSILVAHPNEVVTREELTKRVWEDQGVIVGRSLDTYISKLRKKLQDDKSIKITNIHGVGYKLELEI